MLFVETLIPLFLTSGDISSGFQSQSVQSYLHLAEVYMFHKIHLWYDTCQPLGSQHDSQADLVHIPVSRH